MQRPLNDTSYPEAKRRLQEAAASYYDSDAAGSGLLMSDEDYDALLRSVTAYESANQISDGASSAVASGAALTGDVPHGTPMLSLDNAFDEGEFRQWANRAAGLAALDPSDPIFVLDPKMDGLSLAIHYEGGKPVRAITRGDGRKGEDVSFVIKNLVNLPKQVAPGFEAEVRGEAIFTREQFEAANLQRVENRDKVFVNARNGAAGALRGAGSRSYDIEMSFVAFELIDDAASSPRLDTASAAMQFLEGLGFTTARSVLITDSLSADAVTEPMSIDQAAALIAEVQRLRNDLPYELDGAVIKLDSIEAREQAGAGSKAPRWATAYKFPPQEVTTTLEEIIWQIGRTGVLTPRARMVPVFCAGSTIEYATLHNPAQIELKDLMIGDTIVVRKAGDVIPEILGSLPALRDGSQVQIQAPDACPQCGGELDASQERWRCTKGRACGIKPVLVYAMSRKALDVEGLGKVQIGNLVDSGKVSDLADMFDLTEQDLVDHGKIAPKNAIKVYEGLEAALRAPFERVVIALGIRSAGESGGRALAQRFGSMAAILAASVDELADMVVSVNKLGTSRAENVRADLDELVETRVIARLDEAGMTMSSQQAGSADSAPAQQVEQTLAGMAVCVTGTMVSRTRDEMQQLVRDLGGRPASSVSGKTDLLVAGPGAGSKLAKAEQLGITVLDEQAFLAQYAS